MTAMVFMDFSRDQVEVDKVTLARDYRDRWFMTIRFEAKSTNIYATLEFPVDVGLNILDVYKRSTSFELEVLYGDFLADKYPPNVNVRDVVHATLEEDGNE